jgi:hypothetical protein
MTMVRRRPILWTALAGAAFLTVALATLAWSRAVPAGLTADDRRCIAQALEQAGHPDLAGGGATAVGLSFDEQVRRIVAAQAAAFTAAPIQEPIDFGRSREPCDVIAAGHAYCYDRSRFIEKALRHLGFTTRYAAVYAVPEGSSALRSLLTPGISSHAVVEVRTARGWMVVDSNTRWIGLTAAGQPVDLAALAADPAVLNQPWHEVGPKGPERILTRPFTYVFGLYSRHGRFYAPYDPIPDVAWGPFLRYALLPG